MYSQTILNFHDVRNKTYENVDKYLWNILHNH